MYDIINRTRWQNVKITMLDKVLTYLAPHPCFGCEKWGQPLCDNCKYNIESEPFLGCIACGSPAGRQGVCGSCRFYQKAWCVGARHEILEQLIDAYKFERMQAAHLPLSGLLAAVTPVLPPETIIVPIPTIRRHVRQRGYDHTRMIAKRLAGLKQVAYGPILERKNQSVQRGATRAERVHQAKEAFIVREALPADRPYLIVDDVVTTGATLRYAAKALHDAGAQHVWVAAIARQPSTK